MDIPQEDLRKAQLILVYMMKRIHEVCVKHNIKYWLDWGSLLGAIRHNGFIPWDDDLDISMMREDYEKFNRIAQQELGDEFFWETQQTDPNIPRMFGKVKLCGTVWLENFSQHYRYKNYGFYIDVFPIDNFPEGKFRSAFALYFYDILSRLCFTKKLISLPTDRKKIQKKLLRYLLPGCFIDFLRNCFFSLIRHCQSNRVISIGTQKVLQKSFFENVQLHKFEDAEFYIPEKYHELLTSLYGDYMTPPPPEKRTGKHDVLKYDFGKYGQEF